MQEMRQSRDDRRERPSEAGGHQETDWVEYLTIVSAEGALLAWAGPGRWRHRQTEALNLIAVPKLWLSQTAIFRLVHGRSLPSVFEGATASAPGLLFPRCQPVSGQFPFYFNGEPVLLEAGFVLEGSDPKSIGQIVREVTSLLT